MDVQLGNNQRRWQLKPQRAQNARPHMLEHAMLHTERRLRRAHATRGTVHPTILTQWCIQPNRTTVSHRNLRRVPRRPPARSLAGERSRERACVYAYIAICVGRSVYIDGSACRGCAWHLSKPKTLSWHLFVICLHVRHVRLPDLSGFPTCPTSRLVLPPGGVPCCAGWLGCLTPGEHGIAHLQNAVQQQCAHLPAQHRLAACRMRRRVDRAARCASTRQSFGCSACAP